LRTNILFTYQTLKKMTQEAIRQQIEAIRQASADARKSPESARQFLIDAGIIKKEEAKEFKIETKSKK
jgi:hypothetical protein